MTDGVPVSELSGHKLDAAVAREVVGLQPRAVSEIYDEGHIPPNLDPDELRWAIPIGGGDVRVADNPPSYSDDIGTARNVIGDRVDSAHLEGQGLYEAVAWCVDSKGTALAESPSVALCRAALRAVRNKDDEETK